MGTIGVLVWFVVSEIDTHQSSWCVERLSTRADQHDFDSLGPEAP